MKKRFFLFMFLILATLMTGVACNSFTTRSDDKSSSNLLGQVLPSDGFSRADGSHTWNFPYDFGPHPDYQTEWWYYTGNLQTKDGRKFGYQLTFFRRGLVPPENAEQRVSTWGVNQVYMGHFAISDIDAETHYDFERFARGSAGLAGAQALPFQVWLENWKVEQINDGEWRMNAEQGGVSLDLLLTDEKGVIFQGIEGYSQKGPETGNASYYFSQPRLNSTGTVQINENEFQVSGLSWMDHEFSTSALSDGQVGWDWFSLQMDEGSDLMVFQIRRNDGSIDPYSSGTFIDSEGKTTHLKQNDFEIQVEDTWSSVNSGAEYPSSWTLLIPSIDLVLEIQPYLADQEMNVSYNYWEGAVGFQGVMKNQDISGNGYVELTGYAGSMEGEF